MNRMGKGFVLGVALVLCSTGVWAAPQEGPQDPPPALENQRASQTASLPPSPYPKTTQSPGVDSALVDSWGRQSSYFIHRGFEILTWDEVKGLLQSGKITGGKQYHTGWTVFFTEDDRNILTKPPKIDDPFVFMKEKGITLENFASE